MSETALSTPTPVVAGPPDDLTTEDLHLDADERELVRLELEPLVGALSGPRRDAHAALADAVDLGQVPGALAPLLGSVVELSLQTGRARRFYTAEGEKVLTGLYRRTPQGRQASAHLADVNRALEVLVGERVEGVSVRMRTAGHVTVTVTTPGATITLSSRADGVRVEALTPGPRVDAPA